MFVLCHTSQSKFGLRNCSKATLSSWNPPYNYKIIIFNSIDLWFVPSKFFQRFLTSSKSQNRTFKPNVKTELYTIKAWSDPNRQTVSWQLSLVANHIERPGRLLQARPRFSRRIMCKLNADHSAVLCKQNDDKKPDGQQHVNLIKSKPTQRVEKLAMKISGQCLSRRHLLIILIELIAVCQTVGSFVCFLLSFSCPRSESSLKMLINIGLFLSLAAQTPNHCGWPTEFGTDRRVQAPIRSDRQSVAGQDTRAHRAWCAVLLQQVLRTVQYELYK